MIRMKLKGRMEFSSDTHPQQKVVTKLGAVEFTISIKGDGKTTLETRVSSNQESSPPFITSDLIGAIDDAINDNWGLWEMFTTRTLKDHWKREEVA